MTTEPQSLENMISGCKQQDTCAKECMYRAFYGYITGVVIRYVANEEEIPELVNDSFLKIFNHISSFECLVTGDSYEKSFKGWIARIASRTAIDHLRKNKKHRLVGELEKEEYHLQTSNSNKLETQDILQLMNRLSATHRAVFNLFEIEGFSHDEISRMLKIPASSSRVFLTRAKSKLRALYHQFFEGHQIG